MDIGTVKRHIKYKELDKFYIFTGEELKVQEIYYRKIAEVTNMQLTFIDSVSDIFKAQTTLFSKPKLYVCRDDMDFIKNEKAWTNIESNLGNNKLIYLWTIIDKRTKFYKYFEDKIVTFNKLSKELLHKYVSKEVNLANINLDRFIGICENDYGRLLIECDKIKDYANAKNISDNDAYVTLLQDGAIYVPPMDAIFNFVDAVIYHDCKLATSLLYECKKIGEPSLRLITVLYTNIKKVLQVQSCNSRDVSEATGLPIRDVQIFRNKINHWQIGDLVYMLKLLRQLERGIKVGTIEDSIAIDYFMVQVF